MAAAFDRELVVRSPNWTVFTIAAVAAAVLVPSPVLSLYACVFAVQVLRGHFRPRVVPTHVRVEDEALWFGLNRAVRLAEIKGVHVIPDRRHFAVRIARGLRPALHVEVAKLDDAQGLVHALGFAASQRAMRFTGRPPWMASRWLSALHTLGSVVLAVVVSLAAIAVFGFRTKPILVSVAWLALSSAALAALMVLTRSAEVDVGTDGIAVRWFGRRRFLPARSIADVRVESRMGASVLIVALRDGTFERIPCASGPDGADAVLSRAREAIAVFAGSEARLATAQLARGGRPVEEWLADLRALGAGATTLRSAPLPPEHLWRVVEAASAQAEERVAAAFALSAREGDEARARFRVASQTVADGRLRVALEAAAGGDEAELERAMREIGHA
jgi:hypothetical protein